MASRYSRILALGYEENPFFEAVEKPKGKRGRPKKTKARNLLERLDKHRTETLFFMYDFRVPFDNNQILPPSSAVHLQVRSSSG